ATLGHYRFWVSTHVRRYLWSRTEIAGEQLDHDGDPLELLKGFLVFLVVLAPATALLSLFSLRTGNLYVAPLLESPVTFLLAPFWVLVADLVAVWSLEVAATENDDPAAAKSLQQATWWLWRALLLAVLLLYPIFHAIVLRWRIAGIRFGTLSFASDFSTWRFYKAYLKFYALMVLLAAVLWGVSFLVQLEIV